MQWLSQFGRTPRGILCSLSQQRAYARTRLFCAAAMTALVAGATTACQLGAQSETRRGHRSPHRGTQQHNQTPIDVTALATDPRMQQRVIDGDFATAVHQFGSLAFSSKVSFTFSRGNEDFEQHDVYNITRDSLGKLHVLLDTEGNRAEMYRVGDTIYVRQDRGRLRKKPGRDTPPEHWTAIAYSSLRQALALFRQHMVWTNPRPEKLDGRSTERFTVALGKQPIDLEAFEQARLSPYLPVSPPARWRELARPLDLRGHIWVDTATGIIMQAKLDGRVEIADRDVRPTTLELHVHSRISQPGNVAAITIPEHINEYERVAPTKQPLRFFEPHLAQAEPQKDGANGAAGAADTANP